MSSKPATEVKNLCITLPTTTTLLGDEVQSISDKVVVHETALRFLDSAAVSPPRKTYSPLLRSSAMQWCTVLKVCSPPDVKETMR